MKIIADVASRIHVLVFTLCFPMAVLAQADDSSLFPFVIPWDDATPGTVTDVGHLNDGPAGSGGFIESRHGQFVEADTGRRVRFFATNLGARAAFPSHADADRIAARMAKLGINLVRLHHLQNDWEADEGTIWLPGKPFHDVDPAQLEKIDYLIAALKRNGIYTNMNLTTTREYIPEVGFPDSVNDIPFNHHKKVDKFNSRMIQLQREYAAKLLDRTNPHTGLAYRDDPALAFIEINNENSLVGWPGETPGEGLDTLPEPFLSELVALWNAWLHGRYGSDESLTVAWSVEAEPLGTSLVNRESAWAHETQLDGEVARFTPFTGQGSDDTTGGIRVQLGANLNAEWLVQTQLKNLSLENGRAYTLQFRARADRKRVIGMKIHRDYPDWRDYGLRAQLALDPDWQDFSFSFRAHSAEPGHGQVAFLLAGPPATVEIDAVSLRPGSVAFTLPVDQSLRRRNIPLAIQVGMGPQRDDWIRFLVDTETAYSENMRAFLREELGFRACIIDSQIEWGGLTSLVREDSMEYADAHGYWQHPSFHGSSWDPVNWTVGREALVNRMDGDSGLLGEKAALRVTGKPFSVSEYNHPAPNDFQSEMMPLLSTFACLQDWDGFYTFAYSATGSGEDGSMMDGFFDTGTNPAKVAFYPSTALIFREALFAPASARETLALPAVPWDFALTASTAWDETGGHPNPLQTRLSLYRSKSEVAARESVPGTAPAPIRAERQSKGVVFTADADAAKVAVGFLGGQTVAFQGLTLTFPEFGLFREGFAAVTLVDHAGRSLRSFDRALLTLVGRVENQGMGWNEERTSVGNQWGHGPVMAEGIPATVQLEVDHPCVVYALDPTGARNHVVTSTWANGTLSFAVDSSHRTLWYEITMN